AASIYFPPRVRPPASVIDGILKSLASTGYEDVSLAALSIGDYPYLEPVVRTLMEALEHRRISLSLPSLRPSGLTSDVVASIVKVRKTGFTLVPEAGTERLRRVINKDMDNDRIMAAAEKAFAKGWTLLKLYFMIGLPTENEEDLLGMVGMVKDIFHLGKKLLRRSPRINMSLSAFIPKPHTPFQWLGMEKEEVLDEKFRFVLDHLKKFRSVKIKRNPVQASVLEAVFSRGDRRLGRVLMEAWKRGARFDSWKDKLRFSVWEEAFAHAGINPKDYASSLDLEAPLAWDHIDTGIKKSHLLEEMRLALEEKPSPSCLERTCTECRGCAVAHLYERHIESPQPVVFDSPTGLGTETDRPHRYLAFFSKTGPARFLSHIDLYRIIQQAFRRAGITVIHSQGFRPKMRVSYAPALPLGVEGKGECLEFRSRSVFLPKDFLESINAVLPEGISFFQIKELSMTSPPLSKRIKGFVYALDLQHPEVAEAAERISAELDAGRIRPDQSIREIRIDENTQKLFVTLIRQDHKTGKPLEIIRKILGIEPPVFALSREKILMDI
ncbi:MAG: TIGR03936 family radical SAM-associated protein, partial [Candidatus Aminicenantales bacterium]